MFINNFLKYLQYEKNYSTHTVFAYKKDVHQFFDLICKGEVDPESVDASDVRLWVASMLEAGLSPRTINRKLSSLKSFYKYLLKKGILKDNPVSLVQGPKNSKRLPAFVKENEMQVLLNDVDFGSGFEAVRDLTILELLYGTGMRLSELTSLNHNDVDLAGMAVKVTGKRNKQRLVPITNNLKKIIQNYLDEKIINAFNLSGAFFVTLKGDRVYDKLIYRLVKKHLAMVTTQKKKSPHILRHTFATTLLNKGADINAVKALLGHANLSATEVYTHNTFEELKKVYNKAHPRA